MHLLSSWAELFRWKLTEKRGRGLFRSHESRRSISDDRQAEAREVWFVDTKNH